MSIKLEQWFDTTKRIPRSKQELAELDLRCIAHEMCGIDFEEDSEEVRHAIWQLRQEVKAHNRQFNK